MNRRQLRHGSERDAVIYELHARYGDQHYGFSPLRSTIKQLSWRAVVRATKIVKRLFDLFFASILLVITTPLFILITAAIYLESGAPIFYTSRRIGLWGKGFWMLKFRTMVQDAHKLQAELKRHTTHPLDPTFKIKQDPRITRLGKCLRKLSLDELPQLFNILKGDMSLVGPRPPLPDEVALYTLYERRRLNVLPGLTCIWQVSGRSDLSFSQQVAYDIDYINSHSLWLDIKLLLKTIPAVFFGRGAY